jgi:competence protein ComEC
MHTGSVCLVVGALIAVHAGIQLQIEALMVATAAAVGGACLQGSCPRGRRRRWGRLLHGVVGLTIGSLLATDALSGGLAARLPLSEDGAERSLSGHICGLPEVEHERIQVELCRVGASELRRVRLTRYGPDQTRPQLGEAWTFRARLRVPLSYLNPAGPDLAAHHLFEGLDATGTVRSAQFLSPARGFSVFRQGLADAIDEALDHERGLARALLVGARDGLGSEDWDLLRRTGTAHLVAISGLHITLVATWVLCLARVAQRRAQWRGERSAAGPVLGLVAAIAYAGLAGWAIPTQRAVLMLTVVVLAHLARRPQRPLQTLSLAAAAVVLFDPLAVAQVGFWLSVCAVAALLTASAGPIAPGLVLLRAQALIVILTAPLVSLIGGVIGPATFIANLLAIPWVALVLLPLLLLGAVLQMLGLAMLGGALWSLADIGLRLLRLGLEWVAAWPTTDLDPPSGLITAVIASIAMIVAAAELQKMNDAMGRWTMIASRVGGALLIVVIAMRWAQPPPVPVRELRVTVVDVGQGLAVVIQTAAHNLVYDTGPAWRGGGSTAAITLVPVLRHLGVRHIDRLVISHGDNDHIGGAGTVERAVTVADRLGAGGRACARGERWNWDGVRFSVLHPPDQTWTGNDGSCVILVETDTGSLLLTGDLEALGESRLVSSGPLEQNDSSRDPIADPIADLGVDVVVAPHHGSATSSTAMLVTATTPRLLVVAAGRGNRWRLPRIEVMQRWRHAGVSVLVTGRVGAVTLTFDRQGLAWTSELQRAPWPWRAYGMMREPET